MLEALTKIRVLEIGINILSNSLIIAQMVTLPLRRAQLLTFNSSLRRQGGVLDTPLP